MAWPQSMWCPGTSAPTADRGRVPQASSLTSLLLAPSLRERSGEQKLPFVLPDSTPIWMCAAPLTLLPPDLLFIQPEKVTHWPSRSHI